MAQYRSPRSFPNTSQFLEFLRDASPGQLRFTYDEVVKTDPKKEQPCYRFMSDSRSLQIRGEYKKELEEALYFYQQRGEPLKSEWDVMCAISVRMDSLLAFDHLGYESSRLAQIVRFALKYYTDPIAELTRIGRDYDWDLNHYFCDHPPTRRAVTTSSHPSYMRVIEPLIPPHSGSNTYNRLTAINGGLDMEELWYAYLPNYLKEDIKNHPKETNEYLQSRTRGDEKKIRELMLSGDFFTLNDHLYNHFWGKDDYEKDEKEFRIGNILGPDENYNLEMRMRVQSGMAKIAAELVPYILERNRYNAVKAVSDLSSYLGEMADQALKGVERVIKLSPDIWGMKGNDIQPIITPEYGGEKLANPEKGQDMYERTLRMNSPAHGMIKRQVQEARQSEREQQKKIREREGNARDGQINALNSQNCTDS